MLAAQITTRGRIELRTVEEPPPPSGGDVVVEVETGCVCGSDVAIFSETHDSFPLPLGYPLHEIVGRVVASSSRAFQVGDRVLALPPGLRGFFERLQIRDDRLVPIESSISNEGAVLAQPLGTVLSALSTLPNVIGQRVAVVGQGPIGQLFNAALSNLGADSIIGIDIVEARLARSREFGATDTVSARDSDVGERVSQLTGGAMADLVVEAVGHKEQAFNLCVTLCRSGGRLLYFGVPPERLDDMAWGAAFRKSLTVSTSVPGDLRPYVKVGLRWIQEGRLNLTPLITHRYGLAQVQQAFETYRDRRDGALKVVLDFPRRKEP